MTLAVFAMEDKTNLGRISKANVNLYFMFAFGQVVIIVMWRKGRLSNIERQVCRQAYT